MRTVGEKIAKTRLEQKRENAEWIFSNPPETRDFSAWAAVDYVHVAIYNRIRISRVIKWVDIDRLVHDVGAKDHQEVRVRRMREVIRGPCPIDAVIHVAAALDDTIHFRDRDGR